MRKCTMKTILLMLKLLVKLLKCKKNHKILNSEII